MRIAITGHRPNKLNNDYDLKSPLTMWIKDNIIGALISNSPSITRINNVEEKIDDIIGITGMAQGIDILYAMICIEYHISFIAAIPFKGQEKMWPEKSQKLYQQLLSRSQYIVICDIGQAMEFMEYCKLPNTPFTTIKMQNRNIWMVDNCDILIAVWDGSNGGTANCIKYAESKKKDIIRINPNEFRLDFKLDIPPDEEHPYYD